MKSTAQERLDKYAKKIHQLCKQVLSRDWASLEARFTIGHCLLDARREHGEGHAGDKAFGKWCEDENFPFTRQWRYVLMEAARNESDVKQTASDYVTSRLVTSKGQLPALDDLVSQAKRKQVQPVTEPPPFPEGKYRCLVIDPPWPMEKIERDVRPKQGPVLVYPTMELEAIAALPVPALAFEDGCHVYMWVTHRSSERC